MIAAITSCTNTSNPQVMVGAGLLAKKAVERGLASQALGQDEPRARLEGRHRVLREAGPDAVPRGARLPHRRLRLHDLHRQLGAAAGGDLERDRRGRPRRLRRPLRQPQLRGAHPSGGEGELPRLAAARRRLRARRAHGPRPDDRAARAGPRRQRRLPPRPLALAEEIDETIARLGVERDVQRAPTPTSSRATRPGAACPCRRASGSPTRPTSASRRTSTGCRREPAPVEDIHGRALPRDARRLRHDRPHLAGRRDQARQPGRAATWSSTASSAATSTRTARAAATTR